MREQHAEIATERGILRGMMHLPEVGKSAGTVVIVHGYFSSNRVGPARLYIEMARSLARHAFATMRFDCMGIGDSDGSFADVTVESETADIIRICDFAVRHTKSQTIALIGHSMGANLACLVATQFKQVNRLILLSPDTGGKKAMNRLFDSRQLHELEIQGYTVRNGLTIDRSFISFIQSGKLLALAPRLSLPCLVIHGTEDELYSTEGAQLLADAFPNGHLILIEGADHNYLDPTCCTLLFETIENALLGLPR